MPKYKLIVLPNPVAGRAAAGRPGGVIWQPVTAEGRRPHAYQVGIIGAGWAAAFAPAPARRIQSAVERITLTKRAWKSSN